MSLRLRLLMGCAAAALSCAPALRAESAKTYQVTGPIVALSPSTITVEKNGEKWEIARETGVNNDATLKVGDRVTVHYRMTATKIETKPGKADAAKDDATASAKRKK